MELNPNGIVLAPTPELRLPVDLEPLKAAVNDFFQALENSSDEESSQKFQKATRLIHG